MKRVLTLLLTLLACRIAGARPATRQPIQLTQPDGSVVTVRLHGDEYHHWMTDLDGNLLKMDVRGYLRPATAAEIAPTDRVRQMRQRAHAARKAPATMASNGYFPTRSDNIGVKRGLVIMLEYKDLTWKYSAQDLSRMMNEEGYSVNGAYGSVRDFYMENSDGQFRPEFDVYGPYKVNYSYKQFEDGVTGVEACFVSACKAANDDVDFARYDQDGDGFVDLIAFFYPGYNYAESSQTGTIWPHQYTLEYETSTRYDGVRLGNYFCTSEFSGASGKTLCSIGTTCHEFGHSLGLPDFYDTNYSTNGSTHAMSAFSVMDSGADVQAGRSPVHFTVMERVMLGWISESEAIQDIVYNGVTSLPPVYENHCLRTKTTREGEFFLYEFRDGTRCDRGLEPGMVVYHIDMSNRTVKVTDDYGNTYTYTASSLWKNWEESNSINANGSHPCGYVIPAPSPGTLNYTVANSVIYGGNLENRMSFPGLSGVTKYTAKDWDGVSSPIQLSDIAIADGVLTFTVSGGEDPEEEIYPDLGYNYIIPTESYVAGERFFLKVNTTAAGRKPSSVTWYVDGSKYNDDVLILKKGTQTVTARLAFSNGTEDVIDLVIQAE